MRRAFKAAAWASPSRATSRPRCRKTAPATGAWKSSTSARRRAPVFKFFKRRGVLVFIGLVLLSLFIWYAGPYFAFAEYKPLDPELARLIAIGILVALWLLSLLLKILRVSRAKAKLAQAVIAPSATTSRDGAGREAVQLRERFEEAMA